ncbi:unnamed protein product, partial [marine sediment metagenome]
YQLKWCRVLATKYSNSLVAVFIGAKGQFVAIADIPRRSDRRREALPGERPSVEIWRGLYPWPSLSSAAKRPYTGGHFSMTDPMASGRGVAGGNTLRNGDFAGCTPETDIP